MSSGQEWANELIESTGEELDEEERTVRGLRSEAARIRTAAYRVSVLSKTSRLSDRLLGIADEVVELAKVTKEGGELPNLAK